MRPLSRLYPIIDLAAGGPRPAELAAALARAGCDLLQVRAKQATSAEYCRFAREVLEAVGSLARVIVNDRLDIALALGAAGVHLGEHDLPVSRARQLSPPGFLVGATARDPDTARRAQREGADYLGVGAVFPTRSKHDTRLIGLEGLAEVVRAAGLPVYGIAGITIDNCELVLTAGACGCAVLSLLSADPDPGATFHQLEARLERAAREAGLKACPI